MRDKCFECELYEWAKQDGQFSNIIVIYKNEQDYVTAAGFLKHRLQNCVTISGTQKLDFFKPGQNNELNVKTYSTSSKSKCVSFTKSVSKRSLKRMSE